MTGYVRRPLRAAATRPRLPTPPMPSLDTASKAGLIRQKGAAPEANSLLPTKAETRPATVPPFMVEQSAASLGPLTRHLRRIAFDTYEALAGNLGISPVGSLLLRILATGPCDSDKLRELAALDTVSFAKEIGLLQRSGLTAITAPSADRRRRIYALTKDGRAVLTRVRRVIATVERSFLAGLSEREKPLFTRIFTKLVLAHSANGTIRQNPAVMDLLDGKLDPVALLRRARATAPASRPPNRCCSTSTPGPGVAAPPRGRPPQRSRRWPRRRPGLPRPTAPGDGFRCRGNSRKR